MLGQRPRRWSSIKPALYQCFVQKYDEGAFKMPQTDLLKQRLYSLKCGVSHCKRFQPE